MIHKKFQSDKNNRFFTVKIKRKILSLDVMIPLILFEIKFPTLPMEKNSIKENYKQEKLKNSRFD